MPDSQRTLGQVASMRLVPVWTTLPGTVRPSIIAPQAGGREFQQVPVAVAEIDAAAATRAIRAPLDRNAAITKPLFPPGEFVGADGESDMQRSAAVVRR